MKVYKIKKAWAIFLFPTLSLMIVFFLWILILPFIPSVESDINPESYWILVPMFLGMIIILVYGLVYLTKEKFVIDSEKICLVSVFSQREFRFDEIRGFRFKNNHIVIESLNEKKKNIKVGTHLGKVNEIIDWLSEHYHDLDLVEANQETEEILDNVEFGFTITERLEKLESARKTIKILNWSGGIIGAWAFFWANPYEYAIMAAIIFPLVCIMVLKYFNGLVTIVEKKHTAYPSLLWAFLPSCFALFFRGLSDFHVFDFTQVWTPFFFVVLTFILLITIIYKTFSFKKASDNSTGFIFLIFILSYSYGAIITLNCLYDQSTPEPYSSTILNKRETTGKSTTYYFELAPWANQKENIEISVSKDLYIKFDQNEKVNILLMQGRFDIPWFEIKE
jgi:hypothetical protein